MNFQKKIRKDHLGFQIAPLLDIVFLILIWFIAASIYARWERKIEIKLPETVTGAHIKRSPGELVVNIDSKGRLFINNAEVSKKRLEDLLQKLIKVSPEQPVNIRADETASYGSAIKVLDICRVAKVKSISFSTFPEKRNKENRLSATD